MFHVSFHGVDLKEVTLDAKEEQQAVCQAVTQGGRTLHQMPTLTGRSPTGAECWYRISLEPDAAHRPASAAATAAATGQAHVRVI
ncbi:hypothetical protein EVJ50_13060 [Synechococcus sp. RSCCF101]|uniref:hypothetical protein n=1 Tax=Synechococcus sp. RSCCF101 TaxID=2511069 RepID=UPI001248FDC1|nr:hypothetical protein [Synechococcus sp. RSCCF101]QEY33017.1 hypothetical protein EVJ50_13060 [Synechococcus sp. RSCCF101]